MGVLSASEIAELRALTVELGFADTCRVVSRSRVRDGGEWKETETTGPELPCRLRSTGFAPTERAVAERVQGGAIYAVDLPFGTTIDKSGAILVNGVRRLDVQGTPVVLGNTAMVATVIAVERG